VARAWRGGVRVPAEEDAAGAAARRAEGKVHTIWFHLRQIYGKLQVHSKTEAVAKALRRGLL